MNEIIKNIIIIILVLALIICTFSLKESFVVNPDINNESEYIDLSKSYIDETYSLNKVNQINNNIDTVVTKFLKNLQGVVLSNKMGTITQTKIINTTTNAVYIDQDEVNRIINIFLTYINTNFPVYSFSNANTGIVSLNSISSTGNALIKNYLIPLSLFEKSLGYIKDIKLTVILTKYQNQNGTLVINNIETIDTDPNIKPLLPSISNFPNDFHTSDTNNTDPVILLTQNDIVIANQNAIKLKQLNQQGMCFNTLDSGNITNQADCLVFGGTWDKPVQTDTECPYYLANKNYTNIRGGNKHNYCELPNGLKQISYRYSDPKSQPICYNCTTNLIGQGTQGHCCNTQTTFKSPDYKFNGDQLERQNAASELQNLGLSAI